MANEKVTVVYIVEDNEVERTMLRDHLMEFKNIDVKDFSNGEYVVKEIIVGNLEEPNLILMDYFLDSKGGNSKDGLENLAKIKEVSPDTKVIMLSGVSNERIMKLAEQKGALDYIVKGTNAYKELDVALAHHFNLKKSN